MTCRRNAILMAALLLISIALCMTSYVQAIDGPRIIPMQWQSSEAHSSRNSTTIATTLTNSGNQQHKGINPFKQTSSEPESSPSSYVDRDDDSDEEEDDSDDHYNAQPIDSPPRASSQSPSELLVPKVITSQYFAQDVTTSTTMMPPQALPPSFSKFNSSAIIHQSSRPTDQRDIVEGSGNGPPPQTSHVNEKYDDTEDGGADDGDDEDEDYPDKNLHNSSVQVTQDKKINLESIKKPTDNIQVNLDLPDGGRSAQKVDNTISSSRKNNGSTLEDENRMPPQQQGLSDIVTQNVPTLMSSTKDRLTTQSSLLNLITVAPSFSSSSKSNNRSNTIPVKPKLTTDTYTISRPSLPLTNINQTTKVGNSSKGRDEDIDYDDENEDDDSEDVSNFEDNDTNDEQVVFANKSTNNPTTLAKVTTTTTMKPRTEPTNFLSLSEKSTEVPVTLTSLTTSPPPLSNIVSTSLIVPLKPPIITTTKAPHRPLPDSIVDDFGEADDEDDEDEEDEDEEDEDSDVIEDNIDDSKKNSATKGPPTIEKSTTSTMTTTTTSTTAKPPTTTTTTTQSPTINPRLLTMATMVPMKVSSTPKPVLISIVATNAPYIPYTAITPTSRTLFAAKPSSVSSIDRFPPIRYAPTPTSRTESIGSSGSSSILNYDRGTTAEGDDDLTVQLYNKVIEVYQSASGAIQSSVAAVWPPSLEASTSILEPLMDRPWLFMLAFGGAIIVLVLAMMLIVYIVSYQIEPKDDYSIY